MVGSASLTFLRQGKVLSGYSVKLGLCKQSDEKKKVEGQGNFAMPVHLLKKQVVGKDRILAHIIENKMKWRARPDSNWGPSA